MLILNTPVMYKKISYKSPHILSLLAAKNKRMSNNYPIYEG